MGETLYNDVTYVAVNQHVPESKQNLLWTLKTLRPKKLCLLHAHIPFSLNASSCGLDESDINAIQESERKTSYKSLYKYRDICTDKGVNKEDVDISLISGEYGVGEGIVKFINQKNIKKLVMGAAADPHYSSGMSITSRKAEYVSQHAHTGCKMWFVCKGKLIKKIEGSFDLVNNGSEDPPEHYLCPISKVMMRDPHVAADGFTYEKKNIKKWLEEKGTSPNTGARLDHSNLTPNFTLRSLINDWLQNHPNYED